jgi:hypothetical protein
LGRAQREAERDQALLGAVVQVAFDAAPGLVGSGDDPRAGGGELGAAVGVGDRGADGLGEAGHALFSVGREKPVPCPTAIAPHIRPATTIGAATLDRSPSRRMASPYASAPWL